MKREQKIVAVGAASGVALMILGVWALSIVLPAAGVTDAMGPRLAYALGANVFAVLPFFVMLITVGNSRFFSEAIDPLRHKENAAMEINGRVVENTLQQNFLFLVGTLALSTVLPFQSLQVVWACAIVFVVGRLVFWIGYHINPLYRAPGFSSSAYLNIGIILYVLFKIFVGA